MKQKRGQIQSNFSDNEVYSTRPETSINAAGDRTVHLVHLLSTYWGFCKESAFGSNSYHPNKVAPADRVVTVFIDNSVAQHCMIQGTSTNAATVHLIGQMV